MMRQVPTAPSPGLRLTETYLSELITEARGKFTVPALAITLMNSEAVYCQAVQGARVVGTAEPATLDDYFHIGSCSKSVLAVIAARLIEQQNLAWQTRFFDLLPELRAGANDAYASVTLEDLFLCEGGIKAHTNGKTEPLPDYGPSVTDTRLEFMKHLVSLPTFSAKKNGRFQHLYSNASYTMASAMLERVSGLPYEDLVRKTLSADLGLSVHIGWPNSMNRDQPWGHVIAKGRVQPHPPHHEYTLPYLITPAGDLSMTPKDYAKYTQLHLQGLRGNSAYISHESYRYIHFSRKGFALGVANGTLGGKQYSAFDGSAGTFFCRSLIIPEVDFACTIMMNAGSGSGSMPAVEWLTVRMIKKYFNWWWRFWL